MTEFAVQISAADPRQRKQAEAALENSGKSLRLVVERQPGADVKSSRPGASRPGAGRAGASRAGAGVEVVELRLSGAGSIGLAELANTVFATLRPLLPDADLRRRDRPAERKIEILDDRAGFRLLIQEPTGQAR